MFSYEWMKFCHWVDKVSVTSLSCKKVTKSKSQGLVVILKFLFSKSHRNLIQGIFYFFWFYKYAYIDLFFMIVFIFLLLSFQNVGLCFCHHIWDESLGFCYEPLVSPTTCRERIRLFCKRGKKEKKYPTTCAWRYMGKGVCCLVKINMHTASKGTSYFVIWNIQVIDLKKEKLPLIEPKTNMKNKGPHHPIHKPPKIQDLHVLWGGVIDWLLRGSLKLWNAINQVLFWSPSPRKILKVLNFHNFCNSEVAPKSFI